MSVSVSLTQSFRLQASSTSQGRLRLLQPPFTYSERRERPASTLPPVWEGSSPLAPPTSFLPLGSLCSRVTTLDKIDVLQRKIQCVLSRQLIKWATDNFFYSTTNELKANCVSILIKTSQCSDESSSLGAELNESSLDSGLHCEDQHGAILTVVCSGLSLVF